MGRGTRATVSRGEVTLRMSEETAHWLNAVLWNVPLSGMHGKHVESVSLALDEAMGEPCRASRKMVYVWLGSLRKEKEGF